jgi:hypothetical protein
MGRGIGLSFNDCFFVRRHKVPPYKSDMKEFFFLQKSWLIGSQEWLKGDRLGRPQGGNRKR